MGRNPTADITSPGDDNNGDLGFFGVRIAGFPVKRNPHPENPRSQADEFDERDRRSDRRWRPRSRLFRGGRKGISIKGSSIFYGTLIAAVLVFLVAATMLQSSMNSGLKSNGDGSRSSREGLLFGNELRFRPLKLWRRFKLQGGLDRSRDGGKFGLRKPRLAIVLGIMKQDPLSLMLLTVARSLQGLGYMLKIYTIEDGETRPLWEQIGCQPSILYPESVGNVDWSTFEGVIISSLEAKDVISRLMQEPFCSVPLIWIVQEDTLGKRLLTYTEMGWEHLISEWRSVFSRADVVVFPDFSLPMLYNVLDTGNFFVISGSPVDVWAAQSYIKYHSKYQLRKENGFHEDDLIVLVIGSSFFYNELPWDYAVAMHAIGPLLMKLARTKELERSFKLVFLCGNFTDGYLDALQESASHLGLPDGTVKHYGMDSDVNSVLLMADIVLYGSFHDEQGFPPLLIRAMSYGIPVIAPDLAIIKKYIVDGVHGLIFRARNPDTLTRALSLLVSDMKLSKFAHVVAASGKLLARNMLASECITGYAMLLEKVIHFPSDVMLPGSVSQLQRRTWEWNLFRKEMDSGSEEESVQSFGQNNSMRQPSVVYALEEELGSKNDMGNSSQNAVENLMQDNPTQRDWDDLRELGLFEELERREMGELDDRMERPLGSWDEIYRNARKAEKLKFEANERDEGELERMGQLLCIYEIYSGAGAWPFLHHGSLYRGLSLSTRARRSKSDDVDAVVRLPFLNDTYYRDLLCELGGMFSIANKVDNIHTTPWIGFQSWRATGRKVSLSIKAGKILEETIQAETKGDAIYYWAQMDLDTTVMGGDADLNFWSMCDILNGGHCRRVFEDTFRLMYGLPSDTAALPPMPDDGDGWSKLHSWAMPTPSFLEFIMFSRMFADSLDSLNQDSSNNDTCLLGSSMLEKRHCYCRMLELLVNVWAYHSARKIVYIDPVFGSLQEQHPIEQRTGLMWVKYFNFTLLKSMDEDLAEEADDDGHPNDGWLWPLTGEVHWQGIYEREREERYREKMDKKRKAKEKQFERQKHGYKQKPLGG